MNTTLVETIIKNIVLPNSQLASSLLYNLAECETPLRDKLRKELNITGTRIRCYDDYYQENRNKKKREKEIQRVFNDNKDIDKKMLNSFFLNNYHFTELQNITYNSTKNELNYYIENFKDKVNWFDNTIVDNIYSFLFSFSETTLESDNNYLKIKKKCFFDFLSEKNISFTTIEKYKNELNWELISNNKFINWSNDNIVKYKNYIHWNIFSEEYFLDKYILNDCSEKINWEVFSKYGNLNLDIIDNFSDKISIYTLATNENTILSDEIIEKYFFPNLPDNSINDSLQFRLIKNKNFKPSLSIFTKFINLLDKNYFNYISEHMKSWSVEIFIEYYKEWNYIKLLDNIHFVKSIVIPNISQAFFLNLLEQLKPDEFKMASKYNSPKEIESNEYGFYEDFVLKYGKYSGKSIKEVIEIDLIYLLELIHKSKKFCIDRDLFDNIGANIVYKPSVDPLLIISYEKALKSKARLTFDYEGYYDLEADYYSNQKSESDYLKSYKNDFYKDFDGQFHEDML